MRSYTKLKSDFKTLSLNSSSANDTLGGLLINQQHRYLIQKYFDNERTYTLLTVGSTSATLTASSGTTAVAVGGTQATLSSAWTSPSSQQFVVFSDGEQRNAYFTENSSTITWQSPLSSSAGTSATLQGVQFYPLPANVSKIKNSTITVGQLVYTPAPVQTIQEWTKLNALPYNSTIPAYFFIYQNQIGFWPIPSSSGNVITLNCQINVPDMTYEDYSTGTVALAVGSNSAIGTGTSWNTTYPTGVDLTFANLFLVPTPPNGDGTPYQIQSFTNGTTAVLLKDVVYAPVGSGASYTIGQYPFLQGDFHDMLTYYALKVYFNSIVTDPNKFQMFNAIYQEKMQNMEAYLGTKQVNVDLSQSPVNLNPNLFYYPTS